jgi:hypothetical protein
MKSNPKNLEEILQRLLVDIINDKEVQRLMANKESLVNALLALPYNILLEE